VERLGQPFFGLALGDVAGGRAAAFAPGGSQLLLDLTSVGQPVLGVPDRSARSIEAKDVAGGNVHGRVSGHIRDTLPEMLLAERDEKPR
jgi:hypothetical protein